MTCNKTPQSWHYTQTDGDFCWCYLVLPLTFFIQVPHMGLSALFVWKFDGAMYLLGGGIKSIRAKPDCYLCKSTPFIHLLSDTGFSK